MSPKTESPLRRRLNPQFLKLASTPLLTRSQQLTFTQDLYRLLHSAKNFLAIPELLPISAEATSKLLALVEDCSEDIFELACFHFPSGLEPSSKAFQECIRQELSDRDLLLQLKQKAGFNKSDKTAKNTEKEIKSTTFPFRAEALDALARARVLLATELKLQFFKKVIEDKLSTAQQTIDSVDVTIRQVDALLITVQIDVPNQSNEEDPSRAIVTIWYAGHSPI